MKRYNRPRYIFNFISFNRNLFNGIDFAPSYVTDRPNPNETHLISDTNPNTAAVGVNPTPEDDNTTPAISPSILQDELTAVLPLNPTICENAKDITNHGTVSPKPSTRAEVFSPEYVKPYPKAPPRLTSNKGRKKRKSSIYTDTPEKESIRRETEENERKKKAKGIKLNLNKKVLNLKSKNINKAMTKKTIVSSDDDEDEEYYCLVCMESYRTSRPGDDWVQCSACRMWAHEACTAGDFTYLCHNCESD